jgi:hypothetical protein
MAARPNKKKTTAKTRKSATQEKFERLSRMIGCSIGDVAALAKRVEETLRSVGTAKRAANGRVVIYCKRAVPMEFVHKMHVVKSKALVKDQIDCPTAKCAKDPIACWLGKHTTSVHVGNSIVTFWSELCPHLEVKFMLPPRLRAAIKDWDSQVRRKVKNRRFNLDDGTYVLSPCPPSLVKPGSRGTGEKRGKNYNSPTRKRTVRSDIALAIDFLNAQKAAKKKKAG